MLDAAKLLPEPVEQALAHDLRHALEAYRLEVYVATFRLMKGETLTECAIRLRNAWSQNPHAIVIVYDDSVGQMSMVGSRDLEQFVSAQVLSEAFQRAAQSAQRYLVAEQADRRRPRPQDTLPLAVRALLQDPILKGRMTLPEPFRFTRPMVTLLVGFALLALMAAAGVVWMERRLARQKREQARCASFPTTHMPQRLGAPYSGGHGVTLGE
jgi:hypothetical protein